MESIGDKLRIEREQKGLSVEQIARDTNIAKRYLEALEIEDFSVFPGDPYLIGFLRNYADYLGIDPEEMVSLYKNFTIQSQPVPMDELLERKRPVRWRLILIVVVVIAGLGTGGYLLYPILFSGDTESAAGDDTTPRESVSYTFEDSFERRLFDGDAVLIPIAEDDYRVVVAGISDSLTVEVPGGTHILRIGDERAVDLDGDAEMDIRVALSDIDAGSEPRSAVVSIDRFGSEEKPEPVETGTGDTSVDAASPTNVQVSNVGAPSLVSREVAPVDIRSRTAPEAFRVSVIFRGNCLLRYLIDGDDREERYFQKGETIELDVSSELRLWVSNAGNLIVRINGTELELGRPGEVSTRMVAWQSDPAGGFVLRMVAMY